MNDAPRDERATYSSIVAPEQYNLRMTRQHLYIAQADEHIARLIMAEQERAPNPQAVPVMEHGCGPARVLQRIAGIPHLQLTGVDHDPGALAYGHDILRQQGARVNLVQANICTYRHSQALRVIYAQGSNHHITKGAQTEALLKNVFDQLEPGGAYIVSDEFLAEYANEREREVMTVRWHSHIIAAALSQGHLALADDEAKTLYDDLHEGKDPDAVKTQQQLDLIQDLCHLIDAAVARSDLHNADDLCRGVIAGLATTRSTTKSGQPSMDLSRGDYKICGRIFRQEVTAAGFKVEEVHHLGPIDVAGGFSIYLLRKPLA